jgi:phenylpropionate dioxygenase-like ring-hydroxylating dioxygenase large terminal subunit
MTDDVDLGAAADVPPGAVIGVTVGDEDLVVWRTEGGRLCVSEARCPHQWTHLAAQGTVAGEELVCLAHFWRFDPEGHGVKVAMSGRRDPKADLRVFPSEERDGRIRARLPDGPHPTEGGP